MPHLSLYTQQAPYIIGILVLTNVLTLFFLSPAHEALFDEVRTKFAVLDVHKVYGLQDGNRVPLDAGLTVVNTNAVSVSVVYETVVMTETRTETVVKTAIATKTETVTETEKGQLEVPVEVTPGPKSATLPVYNYPFCNTCGPEDELCILYGEHNLARSRAYEGSNIRFRRTISNALAGKPTKIGVIGGSISLGHGLTSREHNWANIFAQAWQALFPNSKTSLVNGAVAATGTNYFSVCFKEHVDEDVDLVIIELMANDQRMERNAMAYEWLIRGLMALPNNPAVLNLHTIVLSFETVTLGGDLHLPIAEYYDSPTLSLRNMLADHIYNHWPLDEYYFTKASYEDDAPPDWRHVNAKGHRILADMLISYTQRQLCALDRETSSSGTLWVDKSNGTLPGPDDLGGIPRVRFFQQYDRESASPPPSPFCQSMRANKHPLVPLESQGWANWSFPSLPEKTYLRATEPGAKVKFEVIVGEMKRVRLTYLRSMTFGLGDVWCWVGGEVESEVERRRGKKVSSWWELEKLNIASVEIITESAPPGRNILTCEVLQETSDPNGGHEFRIIAVDAS